MEILQSLSLDFGRDTHPITVFAKQRDNESRIIEITPLNNGQPYELESGITARLQLTKADGHTVINDAAIENGIITVELTAQALGAEGVAVAEIGLYKGSAVLSSQVFYIDVKKSAYDSSAPESSDEFNALVDALGKVDDAVTSAITAAERGDEAAEAAESATANAEAAAKSANDAAAAANTAKSAANTAAGKANTATSNANNAATAANEAAENATEKATAAEQATSGAEKVNIKAEQKATGATITVTDREGVETSVHIDTLAAVNTWEDIKNAVRLGLGEKLFPEGYEFTTEDSVAGTTIIWAVRGHDNHKAANGKLEHSMTLEAKYVYSSASGTYKTLVFDAAEALYYATEELAAGTYNFIWNYATGSMVNGTYQFTLTKAVPAGGQIVLGTNSSSTAITSCKIATYESPASTTAIESGIVVTEGSEGTNLGTINSTSATSENLNCAQRIMWGSNNYAQSAARQWLNSDAAAGAVWAPTNKFDRRPSWATSYSGFMKGLPAEFLDAVQVAAIPCRTNSVFEINSLDGTEFVINQVYTLYDKFFVLSRPEIYGTWDSTSIKDGELLEYYNGLTDTERIKYDAAGSARGSWLRSPYPGYARNERSVSTSGALHNSSAYNDLGVAPACIIA